MPENLEQKNRSTPGILVVKLLHELILYFAASRVGK
jgi:hypothetical protein